jgi:transcriptional regulator with XRE-family HTH domain
MAGEAGRPKPGSLADRLNHLFETVHPAGRGPYSNEEVARAVREQGGDISRAYLSYLRNGERTNPTMQHLQVLARFFGVTPAYFFDDDTAAEVDAQLGLAVALRDAEVRAVVLRAAGLSAKGLHAVAAIIEEVRLLEGLPRDLGLDAPANDPPLRD